LRTLHEKDGASAGEAAFYMRGKVIEAMIRPTAARPIWRALLALVALGGVLLALSSGPTDAATTFTVNKTSDAKDRRISDSVCDTSRKRGKQCTLRAAIEESNNTSGADTINFKVGGTAPVKTINVGSSGLQALPAITGPVTINGYTQPGASANTLATGNDAVLKIQLNGTNAGTFADGLLITASNSTIKGLVINRFFDNSVQIEGSGATGNKIEGNFIGTNADGSTALANGNAGVDISNAPNNTVGGIQPAQRNVLSASAAGDGVQIAGSGASGNKVQGNYIGTKADGSSGLGNSGDGVVIDGAPNNTIGGTDSGARNVISDNRFGILIQNSSATDNKVQGNFIGTKADGTGDLGNDGDGVLISTSGALDNTVGGTTRAAGNVISANGGDGVSIVEGTGNSVLSNRIFSNTGLGIALFPDGATANDDDDPDTGANNLQNFPVILSVTQSTSFFNPTTVSGTLNSTPSQNFTVQCFLAGEIPADADPSGHGEGVGFMAEDTDVTTNTSGDATFECGPFAFPVSLEGKRWSATATNEATGDTSEFSANFPVE
jgi:hypothetical protein